MRAVVLIVLTLAPVVVADEPVSPAEELFPLAVGNTWTYRVELQDDRFVVQAVRKEMVGSQTCVLLEARLRDRVVASEHVAFTKEGLCRFKVEGTEVVPPVCILRVPPPKQRWSQRYTLNGREGQASFTARAEEVGVPFGRYKSTLVQGWTGDFRTTPPRTKVWYAAAVGPIKHEIDEGKGRAPLRLELEKFEKAK